VFIATSPLGEMKIPTDNPQTPAKIALGEQLFFDKRLSVNGAFACYSCHQNEDGTGGHDLIATGPKGKLTRHAPVMWNVGYLPRFYWDGRATAFEAQTKAAWTGGNMGVGNDGLAAKAKELDAIAGYKKQFAEVFPNEGVTADNVVKAIVAYERTIVCDNTAYDRFSAGEKKALSAQQQKGLALFNGKAGCVECHTPPFFSAAYTNEDGVYYNVGIGTAGDEAKVDVGRMTVSKNEKDWAAFKVPTLRNVAKSAPYFHDGSVAKLEDAVRYMASAGNANKNLSPSIKDRKLSEAEIKDLVAFLHALDCPGTLKAPKLP
jgi:cytochrome c peroxidase